MVICTIFAIKRTDYGLRKFEKHELLPELLI